MRTYTQVCGVVKYQILTLEATSKARKPKLYVVQSKNTLEGVFLRFSLAKKKVAPEGRHFLPKYYFAFNVT
jgi:hypothetical protein